MNSPRWADPWQRYYQPDPNVYIPPPVYGPSPYVDPRIYGPAPDPQRTWWQSHSSSSSPYSSHAYHPPYPAYVSAKYPNLNPILAADSTMLRFDVRKKPRSEMLASTYYTNRHNFATVHRASHVRLISKAFPWTIDIIPDAQAPVSCEAVWDALYAALQEPLVDSEWGLIVGVKKLKETVEKAAKKRIEDGGKGEDRRMKRIDFLGEVTLFKGLERDEEFEKVRLLPGEKPCPETWVVKLVS